MLTEVACAIATLLVLCWSTATRPSGARCPAGWYVEGIRPSGKFECVRTPAGDITYDGAGGYPDRAVDLPGRLGGRLYCTGGSQPIVIDERTVGCQR